jgi:hypothetical protein
MIAINKKKSCPGKGVWRFTFLKKRTKMPAGIVLDKIDVQVIFCVLNKKV